MRGSPQADFSLFFSPADERLSAWMFSRNTHNNRVFEPPVCELSARTKRAAKTGLLSVCGKQTMRADKQNNKILVIITSLPIIPGIPWL